MDNLGDADRHPQPEEIDWAIRDSDIRVARLGDAFNTLFGTQSGRSFAASGEPGFSGIAASLYTLVALPDRSGPTPALVKVGWGEFSKNTFTNGQYTALQQFPLPLYCVSQE